MDQLEFYAGFQQATNCLNATQFSVDETGEVISCLGIFSHFLNLNATSDEY